MTKYKGKLPQYDTKKIVTYLAVIVIFVFLFKNIFQNLESIKETRINFNFYHLITIFLVTSSLHILNSLSWHFITKAIGLKLSLFENIRIWMLPNLSRYIPGVVWQYMGRAYLMSKQGISKSQGILALVLDGVFTFSIGAFVVLLTVVLFQLPVNSNANSILFLFIPLPILIAIFFSNQKLLKIVFGFIKKVSKKDFTLPPNEFSPIWILVLCFVTFSQFIVAGLVIFLISREFISLPLNLIPVFSGVYAASWILGYISFFAPGGLGVQELSITGLLSFFMPLPVASLVALLFRFMLIISELVISLIVWLSSKKNK